MIVRIDHIVRNSYSQDILRKVDALGRCLYEYHVAIGAFYRIIGMSVIQFCFKVRGPFVQTLCIEKDSYFGYSKTRKINYFLNPPKKAQGYEQWRYVYTHKCFSIQSARDLDIH